MTIYGYARVSTDGQSVDDQVKQLTAAGAVSVFQENVSGKCRENRPALKRAIAQLARGDVLAVTRLDRLARSLRDLLNIIEDIRQAGAGFRSLADSDLVADPKNATGRLMLGVLGSIAAFERELILDRTAAGRRAALKAGVKFGPKPKLNDLQILDAVRRRDELGESLRSIAKLHNVSHATLSRRLPKSEGPERRRIDPETERAARVFLRHLKGRYAPVDALVYGSRARGDHGPDSDTDLAVILKGKPGNRARIGMEMAGIAFDAMRETGILVEVLPLWENELKRPELFSNPALIENIKRDGLRL